MTPAPGEPKEGLQAVIQVCQRCGKVDVIPCEHKKVCNPEAELRRKSDIWEDYKS